MNAMLLVHSWITHTRDHMIPSEIEINSSFNEYQWNRFKSMPRWFFFLYIYTRSSQHVTPSCCRRGNDLNFVPRSHVHDLRRHHRMYVLPNTRAICSPHHDFDSCISNTISVTSSAAATVATTTLMMFDAPRWLITNWSTHARKPVASSSGKVVAYYLQYTYNVWHSQRCNVGIMCAVLLLFFLR